MEMVPHSTILHGLQVLGCRNILVLVFSKSSSPAFRLFHGLQQPSKKFPLAYVSQGWFLRFIMKEPSYSGVTRGW